MMGMEILMESIIETIKGNPIIIIEYIIKIWAILALINPKLLPFVTSPNRWKAFGVFLLSIFLFRFITHI